MYIESNHQIKILNDLKSNFNVIRAKIENAKVKGAFTDLGILIKKHFPKKYKDYAILFYRYNDLSKEISNGFVERGYAISEKTKIIRSLLELIDSIES